jgi:hypothetical protein
LIQLVNDVEAITNEYRNKHHPTFRCGAIDRFFASMVSERLLATVIGSGSNSEILVNISKNLSRMRISDLVALLNCLAIVVLGALFYVVFNEQYKLIALIALACFLAEAITLAVSKIGAYGLIPISREFVEAGISKSSYLKTLGDFLYSGVDRRGYDIHMLFFCLGGILWYYLLFRSGSIPQVLSLWGLIAICLLTIPILLTLYDRDLYPVMGILALPYTPYELVFGVWLIIKGFG